MTLRLHTFLPISRRVRRRFKLVRYRVASAVGFDRYSWPALNKMDRRLVALYGGHRDGRFLEVGANDGLQQSNTLALERELGWTGILVEPNPELAGECRRNRPAASVVCVVASAATGLLDLSDGDLMGTVARSTGLTVGTATLSAVIDHVGGVAPGLIIIDVEGHELELLSGLDLERHGPRHLLIETAQVDAVSTHLGDDYRLVDQWSHHDYLFERKVEGEPRGDAPESGQGNQSRAHVAGHVSIDDVSIERQ